MQNCEQTLQVEINKVANPDPLEVPEGTDAEQTPDVKEEAGESEVL